MNENKNEKRIKKEKEGESMALSMAVVPTLRGKAANSILKTLNTSKIKPYSQEAKVDAERMLSGILQKRDNK